LLEVHEPPRAWPDGLGIRAIGRSLATNRELIALLTRRELSQRYRGSALGAAWPVLQPVLLLGIYLFVFAVVFGAEWQEEWARGRAGYALTVFAGLVTFQIFSESVGSASRLIPAHANFVKRVVFPLEVLPLVKVLAALVQGAIGIAILVVAMMALGRVPGPEALLLPLVWIPFALFTLGVVYAVSAIAVYLRDLDQVIGLVVTMLFFGSAIFYPLSRVPETIQPLLASLPTAVAVEGTRQLLLAGRLPWGSASMVSLASSLLVLVLGYACFQKSRRGFADVL